MEKKVAKKGDFIMANGDDSYWVIIEVNKDLDLALIMSLNGDIMLISTDYLESRQVTIH